MELIRTLTQLVNNLRSLGIRRRLLWYVPMTLIRNTLLFVACVKK